MLIILFVVVSDGNILIKIHSF